MTAPREERVVIVVSEETARALSCGYVSLAAMEAARDALARPEGERPWRGFQYERGEDAYVICGKGTGEGFLDKKMVGPVLVVPVKEGK